MTTAEAAAELGVSVRRVQALAAAGALRGRRLGNQLVFDARAVRRRAQAPPGQGRPFTAQAAWAVLAIASGGTWPADDASLRHRQRVRARQAARAAAEGRFARRGVLHAFRVAAADGANLRDDPRLVLGGVSAADRYGFDIAAEGVVEAYVDAALLERLRRSTWMEPADPAAANLLLRVVPDDVWRVIGGERFAPAAAAAVDLLESDDDRTRRAGARALAQLVTRE